MREPTGMSLRLAAASCAALLTVAGCGGDPEPPGTVPSKAAPSPTSSSPSPTPQTIEEEVEAFVRDYYAEFERAAQTNNTRRFMTLMTASCPCYRAVRVIERFRKKGQSTRNAAIQLEMVRVHDVVNRSAQVEVKFVFSRYQVVDRQGRVVTTIPRRSNHFDLSVIEGADGWLVSNVVNLEGE